MLGTILSSGGNKESLVYVHCFMFLNRVSENIVLLQLLYKNARLGGKV